MSERTSVTTVVRAIGNERTHVVTVPADLIVKDGWSLFGVAFTGIPGPLIARCGTSLRGQRPVVVMKAGTKVRCRPCVFHSGLDVQPEEVANQ